MQFETLSIPGLILLTEKRIGDSRGYFSEVFRIDLFEERVGPFKFLQENQSFSASKGTVRGLHYQLEPKPQAKLVRCIAGALVDIAVDIRKGSPTFGQYVAVELTPEDGRQLWIPSGFAHGFCTLKPDTIISYKVTNYYSPEHDRGLSWDDPTLSIDWPVSRDEAVLSVKDQNQPRLADIDSNFVYA